MSPLNNSRNNAIFPDFLRNLFVISISCLLFSNTSMAQDGDTLGISFTQTMWQIERDFTFSDIDIMDTPDPKVKSLFDSLVRNFLSSEQIFSYRRSRNALKLLRDIKLPCVTYNGALRGFRESTETTTICFPFDETSQNAQFPALICGLLQAQSFDQAYDYSVSVYSTYDERLLVLQEADADRFGRLSSEELSWRKTRQEIKKIYTDQLSIEPLLRRDTARQLFFIQNSHICYQRIGRLVDFANKLSKANVSPTKSEPSAKW